MHMDGSFGECAGTLGPCSSLPPIAQLVEQLPLKQWVPGSSPGGRTRPKGVAARQDERGRENNCFPVEEGLPIGRNGKTVGFPEPAGRTRERLSV